MLKLADERKSLYQWDTDVEVNVEIDAEFVDFRLISSYDLLRVEVKDKIAMIPNILLQDGGAILAYANCVCNGQQTKCSVVFDVIKRPKPIDYVYTETELKKWDDLEERIEALEEREIDVDSELNIESENPIQNKAVAKAVKKLEEDISKVNVPGGIVNTANGETIVLTDSADGELEVLKVCGKSEQDGTPTPENPISIVSTGNDGSVEVGVYGRNLAKFTNENNRNRERYVYISETAERIEATKNNDSGTFVGRFEADLKSGTTYILSAKEDCVVYIYEDELWGSSVKSGRLPITFVPNKDGTYIIGAYNDSAAGTTVTLTNFQIENGTSATPYKPYTRQPLTIPTPNGLPGIKVTDASLATYTDAEGNMWCADEIDFERGVYVQNLIEIELTGSEVWGITGTNEFRTNSFDKVLPRTDSEGIFCTHYRAVTTTNRFEDGTIIRGIQGYQLFICDHHFDNVDDFTEFLANEKANGNPVICYCRRATPIETPLTAEELEAYKALHTNYPTTTIISEAHMEVKYGADTKNYIDNKFAELQTAIVALGGV